VNPRPFTPSITSSYIDVQRRNGLAREFVSFLPREDRSRNPTYWAICRGIANRPALLELAGLVPPPQFAVNVLLAAVHDLLLAGADHELAAHYCSVASRRGVECRAIDATAVIDLFDSFCREHRSEISDRCLTRKTQTNEVGRCAAVRAALSAIDVGPVALLDVGCAAGLNLFVDAYAYDYGTPEPLGDPGARPVLHCTLLGAEPPTALPTIASRTGLDLSPIDVRNREELRWLLACLWPDDLDRFDRLDAAAQVAAARHHEVAFVQGDMVDTLVGAATTTDRDAHLVVLTTWSTAYLPPPRRREFAITVAGLAATRDLTWVVMEHPNVARDLGVLAPDVAYRHRGSSVVCLTRFRAGVVSYDYVAETHAHGMWLDWHDIPTP
jgi:hypothetical protein